MMKKNIISIFVVVVALILVAFCTKKNEDGPSITIPQIIIDADLGSSTDDLFAMQLLYHYADQGRCNILGVIIDRMGDSCAAFADLMNNYYGYPNMPLALERNGPLNSEVYSKYCSLAYYKDNEGHLLYRRSYENYDSLPDGWQLYRKLLSEAQDHSVDIVAIGFASSIAHLLTSHPDSLSDLHGVELVRRKVKTLYYMGTHFYPQNETEAKPGYNLGSHLVAADTLFALWPKDVDIVFSPSKVGVSIKYDSAAVVNDMDTLVDNPILQTYRNFHVDTGQYMWDALPAIQAVEGDSLFALSRRGFVSLNMTTERLNFIADSAGNCRYQIVGDTAWSHRMLGIIRSSGKRIMK